VDSPAARAWFAQLGRLAPHWPLLPGLLVGAVLRFGGLLPAFVYGDEAEYAEAARTLSLHPFTLQYPAIEGFGPTPFVSQPPLLLYMFAAADRVTGSAVAGPLLVSALLGTLTIGLVYGIGAMARDRWLGGLAALFLAVLPFHVSVSRHGQLDAGFTFFFTLTVFLFLRWLRQPTLGLSLGVGTAAAATALAKLPGILVLAPLLLVVAARAVPDLRVRGDLRADAAARERLRRTGLHLLAAGLPIALAVLAYLVHLWLLHSTLDLAQKLGWQASRVGGGVASSRGWDWYFTSDLGLVQQWGWALVGLALVGLGMVAAGLRDPRVRWVRLTLLLWPVTVLAFLIVAARKEWFYAMPLTPAAVLLAAWPVHAAAVQAWRRSKPAPGQVWWRTPGAVLAVAGLTAVGLFAPMQSTLAKRIGGSDYGYGLEQAADWIHAQDPQAAQVGTTLGRFSLHFYNGQPTYHYYVNHTWLDEQVQQGHVRYVVTDPYLAEPYDKAWIDGFVAAHNGTIVKAFDNGRGLRVEVFRLGA